MEKEEFDNIIIEKCIYRVFRGFEGGHPPP